MHANLRWTAMGIVFLAFAAGASAQPKDTKAPTKASPSALTAEQQKLLLFMREEEKLARDVYNHAAKFHRMRVFTNIPRSEQRHMNAMLGLLNSYKIEDPVKDLEPGQFKDPAVQKLYDAWAARCEKSLTEALTVGVEIEKHDIADLEAALTITTQDDIKLIYENLLAGSRRHLAAFQRHLPADASDTQTGPTTNAGRGRGKGQGKGQGQGKGRQAGAQGGCGGCAGKGGGKGAGGCGAGKGQAATPPNEDTTSTTDQTPANPTTGQQNRRRYRGGRN